MSNINNEDDLQAAKDYINNSNADAVLKAQQLFGKFAMYLRANLMYDEEANEDAKQCALIAVGEIIDALENNAANSASWNFYEEVKQEIIKIK